MLRPTMVQYSVQFGDDEGMREKLTRLLADEKINSKSMITARVGTRSAVQFLARKDPELREKLEKMGASVQEDQVFQVELPNQHWELHRLALALAERSINIVSLYSTVVGENMRLVLAVDQTANAVALIEKLGFEPEYTIDEEA